MEALSDALCQFDQWRHLPAYQLERRVDVFFGLFLPEVIVRRFKAPFGKLIPEFPLHKGKTRISEDCGDNQSVNVDFAVFCSKPEGKAAFPRGIEDGHAFHQRNSTVQYGKGQGGQVEKCALRGHQGRQGERGAAQVRATDLETFRDRLYCCWP